MAKLVKGFVDPSHKLDDFSPVQSSTQSIPITSSSRTVDGNLRAKKLELEN